MLKGSWPDEFDRRELANQNKALCYPSSISQSHPILVFWFLVSNGTTMSITENVDELPLTPDISSSQECLVYFEKWSSSSCALLPFSRFALLFEKTCLTSILIQGDPHHANVPIGKEKGSK